MTLAHIVGAADVTQTYKWHCLEIILFLMRDLGTQKKNKHHPEIFISSRRHKICKFSEPPVQELSLNLTFLTILNKVIIPEQEVQKIYKFDVFGKK